MATEFTDAMTRKIFSAPPAAQRGAVLYIALIMLILLALIGIVGMQVAGLQERMSSNYSAVAMAFQGAEGLARNTECVLEGIVNRTSITGTGCNSITAADVKQICDDGFDPGNWADGFQLSSRSATNARLIGPCISGNAPLDMGAPINEDPNPIYQVTVYMTDRPAVGEQATAAAVIDTIFRP